MDQYIVPLNSSTQCNEINNLLHLEHSKIYVVTDIESMKTSYGIRSVLTLDDDIKIFMLPRFQKDVDDVKLKDKLDRWTIRRQTIW